MTSKPWLWWLMVACGVGRVFGDAGREVVVEEFLSGEEVSLMGFCDGQGGAVACMPPARDYKR